jgi:hypothetical protein
MSEEIFIFFQNIWKEKIKVSTSVVLPKFFNDFGLFEHVQCNNPATMTWRLLLLTTR